MTLPPLLQQGLDEALKGRSVQELAKASDYLSSRYRKELRDGSFHLSDELKALAYLTTRLPATYSAIRESLAKILDVYPGFEPESLLDIGAGPGSALWACHDVWPQLKTATLLEGSEAIRKQGEKLAKSLPLNAVSWLSHDLSQTNLDLPEADLVTLAYVLNELEPSIQERLIVDLWKLTKQVLLIVEPGTTAGWQRLITIREQLFDQAALMIAPCPHSRACPLTHSDWCHFSARLERSKRHRQAKGAELGYEDEKYSYLALSKTAVALPEARILASPQSRSGLVTLKLCTKAGLLKEQSFSKREGSLFKTVKRLDWGDSIK